MGQKRVLLSSKLLTHHPLSSLLSPNAWHTLKDHMNAFPSEQPTSFLSLVKRLAGERWISVYETLLDVSGAHRYAKPHVRAHELLTNIASQLLIVGNTSDATHLKCLTDSFSANHEDTDALVVLMLSSNIGRTSCRDIPQFPVTEIVYPHRISNAAAAPRPFIPDDIFEAPLRTGELFPLLWEESELADRKDCIADSSRCEHESYNLWLHDNVVDRHSPHNSSLPSPSITDQSGAPLNATNEPKLESETGNSAVPLPGCLLPSQDIDATQEEGETCKTRLHHLLHMCIAGPILDGKDDSASSSRSALLLKSSRVGEDKRSTEQSQAFSRRRKIVKELRSWTQQLRSSPIGEYILPSQARALMCGLVYQSVLSFGPAYLSEECSTALKALASLVELRADSYVGAILKLADPSDADPTMLELLMLDTAESFCRQLWEIERVLERIEETDGSSEWVLSILSDHLRRSPCSTSLQELFLHVAMKYEKVLRDWVTQGSCASEECISIAEFTKSSRNVTDSALNMTGRLPMTKGVTSTVGRTSLFSEPQALFLRRAGHGRAILREMKLEGSCPREPALQDVSRNEECRRQQRDTRVSSRGANDKFARAQYIHVAALRAFTDPLQENSNEARSASSTFETQLMSYFASGEKSVDSDNNGTRSSDEENVSSDRVNVDIGHIKGAVHPTLYAEQTISKFRKIDGVVQRKIFEKFVDDLEIFAHLDFIRKYILLGAGDFASALVEQVNSASLASESSEKFLRNRKKAALTFYGSADAGKRDVRSLLHLERCFRTVLYLFNTGSDTERFASHLKLELCSRVDEAQLSGELWDQHIEFVYEIADPLKLVISAEAMSMYSKIHGFFLRVHRAKMCLRKLFMITRRRSAISKMPLLSLLRNSRVRSMLWVFCMDSEKFVNTLGGFFMDQVIGSAWESFEGVWQSCESVWALQDAHRRFLEGSMQRCLLDPRQKNLRNVISGGLEIIHNVEKEMSKIHECCSFVQVDMITAQDLICSASASLRRRGVFLSDVLERLSEAGTWHATSFMGWSML